MQLRYQEHLLPLVLLMILTLSAVDLYAAACISGFVRDRAGQPVADGDIDVFNVSTGAKLVTLNDNTTIDGYYSICLLPGIYHVAYAPPDSSHLMGKKIFSVDLTNNQPQAINITLDSGLALSGRITDPLGQPVTNVDIDVDSIAGGRVYTPNDNSNLTGAYWIVVPPGLFRVRFDSPLGSRLRGQELDSVSITADTVIDLVLPEGWLLSGKVTNESGQNLRLVEIGLRDAVSGAKLFIANNKTDSAGLYSVSVPTGMFELRFAGAPGTNLVGVRVDSVDILADMIRDQVMAEGLVLSVRVEDELGVPIRGADIDLKRLSNGEKLFTPNDKTDDSGLAIVAILPDLYQLEIDPPLGSPFDQVILPNLTLANDTALTVTLPSVTRLAISGRVVDIDGFGLGSVELNLFSSVTGKKAFLVDNSTDSAGEFTLAVPAGQFDLTLAPPSGTRLVGRKISDLSLTADQQLPPITLVEGLLITIDVIDAESQPVAGVDLDLIDRYSGEEQFTPRDNTDQNGRAVVVVGASEYEFLLEPPIESGLSLLRVARISLTEDTLLTFLLSAKGSGGTPANFELGQNYPNPFNTLTTIPIKLVTGSNLVVDIFNILGQQINRLADGHHEAAVHNIPWRGTDYSGNQVASGVYFCRVRTPLGSDTRRIVLIK